MCLCVCVCVCVCAVAVAVVYSSMADCSKYTVEEAGFDISALKTSLIQYFRCRSRPGDHCSLPPRISEAQRSRTPLKPGINRKWTGTAAAPEVGFPREKKKPHKNQRERERERESGRVRERESEVSAAGSHHFVFWLVFEFPASVSAFKVHFNERLLRLLLGSSPSETPAKTLQLFLPAGGYYYRTLAYSSLLGEWLFISV